MEYLDSFKKEAKLISQFGVNSAFIVWSMGLFLNTADLNQLASDCLTDCPGDKKIDFLNIDLDELSNLIHDLLRICHRCLLGLCCGFRNL